MSRPPTIRLVTLDGKAAWWARCSSCRIEQLIDEDQRAGRCSMDCSTPGCTYHETHDLRLQVKP